MRLAAALGCLCLLIGGAEAADRLPAGFVHLRTVDPSIEQDIRYAGGDNFTGARLPGYQAGECILLKDAAEALKQVQADLKASGLGLKAFDCYRPAGAVKAMADWAGDGKPAGAEARYFPNIDKAKLHSLGYIARRSAHSTGTTIDLTVVRLDDPADHAVRPGVCTGPAATRSAPNEVDMGTGLDCLDPKSNTASAGVGTDQRKARQTFVAAMAKRGFANYSKEWWHFSYSPAGKHPAKDFPVTAPPAAIPNPPAKPDGTDPAG